MIVFNFPRYESATTAPVAISKFSGVEDSDLYYGHIPKTGVI